MKKDAPQECDSIVRYDELGMFEIIAPQLLELVAGADSSIVGLGVNSACELTSTDTACVAINQVCEGAMSRNGVCADLNQSCRTTPDPNWNVSCLNQLCVNPGI